MTDEDDAAPGLMDDELRDEKRGEDIGL